MGGLHGGANGSGDGIDTHAWWQKGVVYQVYPRSFADSDGDGVGDLLGMTGRMEYLAWLGVDAVWISPIYPSPMVDFGYDVTDHTDVHPMFGALEHFDALVLEAHRLGLGVILDYIPNHTSEKHPWFLQSRSARDDPKREWYLWRDPAPNGGPPNNWLSVFGGSAWTFDEATGQYYYHAYLKEQPDLNWRNPQVREAMHDVMRSWLRRGVEGFRVDALRQLIKDDRFRDNPPNPDYRPGGSPYDKLLPKYSTDRPEIHEIIRGMRRVLEEYGDDRLLIGELYLPIDRLVRYYGEGGSGVQLPMNFHLISTPWEAEKVARLIDTYEASLPPGAWPTWVLGNHDRSRVASRVGAAQARVAAMLLLTLRGTPTLYYGDELGMRDVPIPPELVQDPFEKNAPGIGLGRDPERTPMQWSRGETAGFTTGKPWLPVSEDHVEVNVESEGQDSHSMLSLHRRLLALRRAEPALAVGSYAPAEVTPELLAYSREMDGRQFLIALNLGSEPRTLRAAELARGGQTILSTFLDREDEAVGETLDLRGDEGLIVEIA